MRDRTTYRRTRELFPRLLPIVARGGLLVVACLALGCRRQAPASTPATSSPASAPASVVVPVEPVGVKAFEALPVTMRVAQRTTTAVPGTGGHLSITIDDITRGQVMISLLDKDGKPIAGPTSVKQDQAISFRVGETGYAARVLELSNALVGDGDFVTIVIDQLSALEWPGGAVESDSGASAAAPKGAPHKFTERQKIERLLAVIEAQRDAKFVRNGTAYSATEAADHLRMKLENRGKHVRTARDFIEKVASRSSVSGKDYLIELPDGRVLTTGQFLREALAKIEHCAKESE